jgi:hypothetical protein
MMARTRLVAAAVSTAVLVAGSLARADDSEKVAVFGTGPGAEAIASGVESHLNSPYSSVDPKGLKGALGAGGLKLVPLAMKRKDKDAEFVNRVRGAERAAHVDKAIIIHTEKVKKATVAHVWLIEANGSGSAPVDENVKLAAGASAGDGADAVWDAVSGSFPAKSRESTPPPVAAESAGEGADKGKGGDEGKEKPASEDATAAASSGSEGAAPKSPNTDFAAIGLVLTGGSRHFSYTDRLTPTLRPYDITLSPMIGVRGEIYPFSKMTTPVLSGLGLVGDFAKAIGIDSKDSAGNKVDTSWQFYDIGLRERLAIGSSLALGINVGFSGNNFSFDNPVTANAQLPSTDYQLLRLGVDGRYVVNALSFRVALSYLDVLSTGELGNIFPHESEGGIEIGAGAGYMLGSSFELSLDVLYQRFFYNLAPVPGDAYVAGGALDQMITVSLGLAYLF